MKKEFCEKERLKNQEICELENRIGSLSRENECLTNKQEVVVKSLVTIMSAKNESVLRNEELETQLIDAKKQWVIKMKQFAEELTEKDKIIDRLTEEKGGLENKLDVAEYNLGAAERKLSVAETLYSTAEKDLQELEDFKHACSVKNNEVLELKKHVEDVKAVDEEKTKTMAALQETINGLQSKINDFDGQKILYEKDIASLKAEQTQTVERLNERLNEAYADMQKERDSKPKMVEVSTGTPTFEPSTESVECQTDDAMERVTKACDDATDRLYELLTKNQKYLNTVLFFVTHSQGMQTG